MIRTIKLAEVAMLDCATAWHDWMSPTVGEPARAAPQLRGTPYPPSSSRPTPPSSTPGVSTSLILLAFVPRAKGKVVTRAKLPEGARLTVVVHDGDEVIDLDAEDEAEISRGIAEIRSGQFVGVDRARAFLRRK